VRACRQRIGRVFRALETDGVFGAQSIVRIGLHMVVESNDRGRMDAPYLHSLSVRKRKDAGENLNALSWLSPDVMRWDLPRRTDERIGSHNARSGMA
jgi:hypothetical protein